MGWGNAMRNSAIALAVLVTTVLSGILTSERSEAAPLLAVDQGWYDQGGAHNPDRIDILTINHPGSELRSFVLFDLTSLTEAITSAELTFFASNGQAAETATNTLSFYDVTTPASALTNESLVDGYIFDDLGDGTLYGSTTQSVVSGEAMPGFSVSLNAVAVAALEAARLGSGFFAVGIVLSGPENLLFVNSGSWPSLDPAASLAVNNSAAVPVPAAFPLLGGAMSLLGLFAWRRKHLAPS